MEDPYITGSDTPGADLTRGIPPSLAPVLQQLELDAPVVVTHAQLTALLTEAGIGTPAGVVANRLRKLGWLLPTGTRGVWEFAPGAHAGALRHGDPYLELRAALAVRPDLNAEVCLSSALATHGFLDRRPERLEVALRTGTKAPDGLRRAARVVTFDARLVADSIAGLPVHRPATVLVHLAARPADVRDWGAIGEALGDLVGDVMETDIDAELAGRPRSVRVRLAYLVHGVAPALAERLVPASDGGRTAPRIWFGLRGPVLRGNVRFSVADTTLPFDPATLHAAP